VPNNGDKSPHPNGLSRSGQGFCVMYVAIVPGDRALQAVNPVLGIFAKNLSQN
jgi:hypothetical protein